jgi:hypothetical protein
MRLHCKLSDLVARTQLDYVRRLAIRVACFDEAGLNKYTVARLAMD